MGLKLGGVAIHRGERHRIIEAPFATMALMMMMTKKMTVIMMMMIMMMVLVMTITIMKVLGI